MDFEPLSPKNTVRKHSLFITRILFRDAAAQCKSEDSTLHHPSTMNSAYYKEYILPRISVDILWLNGYQKDINIWELESSPHGDFRADELRGGPVGNNRAS